MAFQLRRGLNTDRLNIKLAQGELVYTTDTKKLFVGDGITVGGTEVSLNDSDINVTVSSGQNPAILAIVTKEFVDNLGINAVKLDGYSRDYYRNYNNLTNTPSILDSSNVQSLSRDSSFVSSVVDSSYVNNLVNTSYIQSKIDQLFIDTFDTHDSGAVQNMIDIAVAANDTVDSAAIAAQIINTVNQAFIDTFNTHDSIAVGNNIDSKVDQTFVRNFIDQSFIQAFINQAFIDTFDTHDEVATLSQINSTIDGAYVRNSIDQAFIDTFDTHDSNIVASQIYTTVTQSFIDQFDTHDSAAVQAQIDAIPGLSGDAETLDGNNPSYYLNYNNFSNTPNLLDSSEALNLINTSYVQSKIDQTFINTFDTHDSAIVDAQINAELATRTFYDSAAVQAQIDSAVTQSFIDQFDTHDSAAVDGQINAELATRTFYDSAAVQNQIDSAVTQSFIDTFDTHDSVAVLGQITSTINTSYVQGKIDQTFIDGFDTHDSVAIQNMINTTIAATDTHDSAAVLGQINSTVDQTFVRNFVDQSFVDTFDTHDSVAIQNQITSTVNQSFINGFDTHDSVAVQGQIDTTIAATDTHDSAAVDAQIDAKLGTNVTVGGNLSVTGYIDGPEVFTIDPAAVGDATGKVVILGDLQVDGVQTTINSTEVSISDKNIVLADSATSAAEANGAGITVNGASATLQYVSTGDKWEFNKPLFHSSDRVLTTADDLHDSAAVQGQIDSSATAYTLDFITTNGNTTTNNIEVGTINTLQVNNGNGDDEFSTAVGRDALVNVNSGTLRNTAFGRDALEDNISGVRNTAVGSTAMSNATTGGYNTAIGQNAMGAGIVTGSNNAALGANALESLENGSSNTAVGRGSLSENTSGGNNTAVGRNALFRSTTGVSNIAIGSSALALSSAGDVNFNVAIGHYALEGLNPGQNSNIAIGYGAGRDLDSGIENTIIGLNAEASSTNMSNEITLGDNGGKSFRIPGSQFYINGGSEGTTGSRVGINTSTPTAQLDVNGNIAVDGDITFSDSDDLILPDNSKIKIGNSADLEIYHDGSNSYVKDIGTGVLNVQGSSQVNIGGADGTIGIQFVEGANVTLRHNNVPILTTASTGINVTGDITFSDSDNIVMPDNSKIKMGTGADLEIYHDGSHSYVDDRGTGDLRLRGNGSVKIMQYNNGELMAAFKVDDAVELYHDNVKKFETTSTGIDVTGSITTDSATISGSLTVDTDTLFVDAVNNKVGIGTTSPLHPLTVTGVIHGTSYVQLNSGQQIKFGNGNQYIEGTNDTSLEFATGGSASVTILDDGKVGIGTNAPTGKVEIEDDGAVNDRLLYLNSAGGLSGGQSGPFYGLYADIKSNNSATEAYGAYIEAEGGTSDDTYGIWAQATQNSSTVDAIGVLGKTIVNSGSTNHWSTNALGTGPAAGVYALAETTGTGTASQTTALHVSNASTHGSLAYGAYIETISGPTTVVPLRVDHDGSEIFKLDSAGNATISGTVTATAYAGDGSSLTGISAGATGGSTDQVFYENDQAVTTNYTISTNKNAMTAGPITVNAGVTVTIPTGSEWSIV